MFNFLEWENIPELNEKVEEAAAHAAAVIALRKTSTKESGSRRNPSFTLVTFGAEELKNNPPNILLKRWTDDSLSLVAAKKVRIFGLPPTKQEN